jgi:uncharacterized delta-60 repeat protein
MMASRTPLRSSKMPALRLTPNCAASYHELPLEVGIMLALTSNSAARRRTRNLVFALALGAASSPALALAPGEIGSLLTFPVSNTSDDAHAAVMDPDDALVMVGSANSGASSALARMSPEGLADGTFGTSGILGYNFSPALGDQLRAIVRMGDGRYAACGEIFSSGGTARDFLTARFNSDGTLDSSFNLSGWADTPFLGSGVAGLLIDSCNAVAVQADGKIISAGYTQQFGPQRVALVRYATDGTLDGTFGIGGKLVIDASASTAGDSSAQALLIQPDGKLLIAGNAAGVSNSDFLMMRLNGDGTPDSGFGTNGIVRTPVGTGADIANAMVLQPDGKIVLAGQAAVGGFADFALVRYTSTGAVDATFGTGGLVMTAVGPGEDIAYALALMPWGRLVAAGSARISTSAQGTDIAAVAYNADGSLDRYFGNNGKVMVQATAHPDEQIYGLAMDASHTHLWAVGSGVPAADRDFLVLQFGLPDTIFRNGFQTPTP